MKNSFRVLTGMSQEMRSYMNSIVGFTYLIERNSIPDEENKLYNNQILNSVNQLIWLFDSYLDSAIIDIGKTKVNLRRCKFKNSLDNLLSEFREELMQDNNRRIALKTENNSFDFSEVIIDSPKVLRVIRSLFQNAVNNTDSGYIKIGSYVSDGKITFYVLDSGKDHSKFKEFINADDLDNSLTKFNDLSSAINITLAKKIVHLMGGTIWLDDYDLTRSGIYFSVPAQVIESSENSTGNYVKSLSESLNNQ